MDQFSIKFAGLKNGKHDFEFSITDKFFEDLDYSLIMGGDVSVQMEMDKGETMLVLNFIIDGGVKTECDRCMVDFTYPIHTERTIFVKLGNKEIGDNDELIVIPRTEHQINVAQFIYEFIALELPVRKTACNDEENSPLCDRSVIDKIQNEETKEADPRWNALKNIVNDN